MGTSTNVVRGKCTVWFGAAGATEFSTSTFTNIGYTSGGGYKVAIAKELADIEVDQENFPVDVDYQKENHTISFTMAEVTLANLARALGITAASNATSLTLVQDTLGFAAIGLQSPCPPVGTVTTNGTRTFYWPHVLPNGDVTFSAGEKGKAQDIPCSFKYYKRITNLPTATDA